MENAKGFTLNVNGTVMLLSLIDFALKKGDFFSVDGLINVGVLVEQAKQFIEDENAAAGQAEQLETVEDDVQPKLDI